MQKSMVGREGSVMCGCGIELVVGFLIGYWVVKELRKLGGDDCGRGH